MPNNHANKDNRTDRVYNDGTIRQCNVDANTHNAKTATHATLTTQMIIKGDKAKKDNKQMPDGQRQDNLDGSRSVT